MHWVCFATIVAGFIFVLAVGVISVLHDLMAIDDCHLNDEIGRSRRSGGTGAGVPSHELVGGTDVTRIDLDMHDFE